MHSEHELISNARSFVANEVAPRFAAGEAPRFDAALNVAAAAAGLFGFQVPPAFGGAGASFTIKARIAEILAGADFGLAMSLINTQNVANHLARSADAAIARRYVPDLVAGRKSACTALTEPGAGSDFAAIKTTATPVDGNWRLDGAKAWIINALHAEVLLVYAQTRPDSGAAGIAAFVVDANRAGFARGAPMTGALPAMGTGSFRLAGYVAAADEMLFAPGQAFKRAMTSINGARIYVAAMCCGMVDAALTIAANYGRKRSTFGQILFDHQGWRWSLADAAVDLEAARLMVADAVGKLDAGADVQGAAARAKVFATRMAQRHLGALLHAMGAEGLRDCHPFLRHIEGAQAAAFTDGSTEMLLERIARELRGKS